MFLMCQNHQSLAAVRVDPVAQRSCGSVLKLYTSSCSTRLQVDMLISRVAYALLGNNFVFEVSPRFLVQSLRCTHFSVLCVARGRLKAT